MLTASLFLSLGKHGFLEVQQIPGQEPSADLIFFSSASETRGSVQLSLDVVILGLQQELAEQRWLARFSILRAI